MSPKRSFIQRWQTINLVRFTGLLLFIVAAVLGVLGYINQHSGVYKAAPFVADFYANASTELASIAFTVLIIDYLSERRERRNLKAQLIRELQTRDNGIAHRTMQELLSHGWQADGSLRGQFLNYSNFKNVYMRGADFTDCALKEANFEKAWMRNVKLTNAHLPGANFNGAHRLAPRQLMAAKRLVGATLPNGARYDGRFKLAGDLKRAQENGIDIHSPSQMATYYGVTLQTYHYWQTHTMPDLDTFWEELEDEAENGLRPFIPIPSSQSQGINQYHFAIIGAIVGGVGLLLTRRWWR